MGCAPAGFGGLTFHQGLTLQYFLDPGHDMFGFERFAVVLESKFAFTPSFFKRWMASLATPQVDP
jgi:hypothetical protein